MIQFVRPDTVCHLIAPPTYDLPQHAAHSTPQRPSQHQCLDKTPDYLARAAKTVTNNSDILPYTPR